MTPPPFETSPALEVHGLAHAFFGRQGGVSHGLYASLNCGPGSGDAPEAVAENRARCAAALNVAPDRLLNLHQIHSANVVRVDAPWSGDRPKADALVSTTPGLAIGVLTADCAPVLFADPEGGVIGAAHAGWKGALAGILEATIAEMERAGAKRARLRAAIGPAIAQPSYEVGMEFVARFCEADPMNMVFFRQSAGDKALFNLPRYCADRLHRLGLYAVDVLAADTCALPDRYFSFRRSITAREPDYGRNLSAIALA